MHFVRIVETLNEPLLTLMKKYLLWIWTVRKPSSYLKKMTYFKNSSLLTRVFLF